MTKIITTLLLLLLFPLGLFAQKNDTTLISPDTLSNSFSSSPSHFGVARDLSKLVGPNVAAFEKRGRIPVGYNTGQLNLSIPLMNLVVDDYLQLPVTLPYSNSGLKPAEVPTSIGNGWSLPLGGTIVQYFKGLDDFGGGGLQIPLVRDFLDRYNASSPIMPSEEKYPYLWDVASQNMDSQFDVFSLNFGSRSNQFYFDNNEIKLMHHQQLKISYASGIFTVTDEMGYQYLFGLKKISTGSYVDDGYGGLVFSEGTATWFLTKIITPHGQEVMFLYQEDISYQISEIVTSYSMGPYVLDYVCIPEYFYRPTYSENHRTVTQKLLKAVEYPGGSLQMEYIDRHDLQTSSGVKSKALAALRHRNINNEVIGKAVFQYHYMHPASQDRLMLSSVSLSGKDTTITETFSFEYYPSTDPIPIPSLVKPGGVTNPPNHAVDYQEYYNGNSGNINKVPMFAYPENSYNTSLVVGGANRTPNAFSSRQGMLRKIIWPDKGYEEFYYEANSYNTLTAGMNIIENSIANTMYEEIEILSSAHCDTVTQIFTIYTAETDARVLFNAEAKSEPVTLRIKNTLSSTYLINSTVIPDEELENTFTVNLEAGNYQYEMMAGCASSDGSTSASVTIQRRSPDQSSLITGGNRIMKVKRYSSSGRVDIRRISYGFSQSSVRPVYWYSRGVASPSFRGNYCVVCEPQFVITGNNVNNFDGFHVQYNIVTERSHLNGQSRYVYELWPAIGFAPHVDGNTTRPAFPWRHGLLNSKADQRKMNRVASIETYTHKGLNIPPWKGLGLLAKFNYHCPTAQVYGVGATFSIFSTGIVPVYTDTTAKFMDTKSYHNDFSGLLYTDSTIYEYNSRWQPYRIQNNRSDGGNTVQTTYYAEDFNNAASATIASLKSKHIVGKPLKTTTTVNGNTIGGQIGQPDANGNITQVYNYESAINHAHNPAVFPSTDFTLQENRNYNSKGKLSGFTGRDGISYVYLWSYNFTHPVALIANATESQVAAVIGNLDTFGALTSESSMVSAFNNLRASLPLAHLTTALYYPGIGIKQLTQPDGMLFNYEYDGMNRLKVVKDRNGKETDLYSYQTALTLNAD
jgi:hypothetical protein